MSKEYKVLIWEEAYRLAEWKLPVWTISYLENRVLYNYPAFFEEKNQAERYMRARLPHKRIASACKVQLHPSMRGWLQLTTPSGKGMPIHYQSNRYKK